MFSRILKYGTIAGVVVGGFMSLMFSGLSGKPPLEYGMLIGYASMLIALSAVFVGIKRQRDDTLGGVIRFWPAFGMGLGISVVAGVIYALAWEAAVAASGVDFAAVYSEFLIEQQRAAGASEAAIEQLRSELATFAVQYANPWYRLPMTFIEIFPVGVLVSLVSAGLLRNPRFMAVPRD
ncbi:MAG: DUF4199 domain-containing protein [Rhodanobacteraceae bacterium]|nr:DUF4199 domain-containing protein [Rhodanobacteraceae bacterium]